MLNSSVSRESLMLDKSRWSTECRSCHVMVLRDSRSQPLTEQVGRGHRVRVQVPCNPSEAPAKGTLKQGTNAPLCTVKSSTEKRSTGSCSRCNAAVHVHLYRHCIRLYCTCTSATHPTQRTSRVSKSRNAHLPVLFQASFFLSLLCSISLLPLIHLLSHYPSLSLFN